MSGSASFVSKYRWPIGIVGIVICFFIADGLLIFAALSDHHAIAPADGYYERAVGYDKISAKLRRAQLEGLRATIAVADAPFPTMPRRVDVRVLDNSGRPISDLEGRLTAIRPSDARLRNDGELIPVPGKDGLYRLLLKLPIAGLWEFEIDARRGTDDYLMIVRQDVEI